MNKIFVCKDSLNDKKTFSSVQDALDYAGTLCENNTIIYISGGEYFFEKPLEIRNCHSGITLCAYNSEKVTFTGAVEFKGLVWSDYPQNTNIKYAKVTQTDIDAIIVNGKYLTMARYPNEIPDKIPLGGVTSCEDLKSRSVNWKNPHTGRIRALHKNGWGGNDYFITGKNENSPLGVDVRWVGDNNRGSGMMENAVVVENIFEELDCEGEWFFDKDTGTLYVYPYEDMDLSAENVKIEAVITDELVRITGESSSMPVSDISICGIDFKNTKRNIFTVDEAGKEYIQLMRGDWCVTRTGALYIENAENVSVSNCSFTDIGGNAVFMYAYNSSHKITENTFSNLGASGIQIVGNCDAVSEPSFWEHDLYPNNNKHLNSVKNPEIIGPVSENYPRDILISENLIENIGVYEKQSSGVNLSVSSRIKILHNTIRKSARSNINVNDGTFGGHEIAFNDIFDSQRETTDHGPFNSWGRDRFWSVPRYDGGGEFGEIMRHYTNDGVHFFDITKIDAYQTTKIHDNRFEHEADAPHTWGIDLDDGSSNYEIYNNLCLGGGIKLREGFDRRVYNNIIIDGKIEIHVSYNSARDIIFRNIIVNSQPWNFIAVDKDRYKRSEYAVSENIYFSYDNKIELPHLFDDSDNIGIIGIDPEFKNPAANDYTVTNKDLLKKSGFVNFDMDGFGKKSCGVSSPIYAETANLVYKNAAKRAFEEWNGAVISDIDDSVISATGSFGYDGAYFENVPVSSAAYKSGFRTRDIVKKIDGMLITDIRSFIEKFNSANNEMTAEIHRSNSIVSVKITK